jgi:hypothetical protein
MSRLIIVLSRLCGMPLLLDLYCRMMTERSDREEVADRGRDPGLRRANPATLAEERFPGLSDAGLGSHTIARLFECAHPIM